MILSCLRFQREYVEKCATNGQRRLRHVRHGFKRIVQIRLIKSNIIPNTVSCVVVGTWYVFENLETTFALEESILQGSHQWISLNEMNDPGKGCPEAGDFIWYPVEMK